MSSAESGVSDDEVVDQGSTKKKPSGSKVNEILEELKFRNNERIKIVCGYCGFFVHNNPFNYFSARLVARQPQPAAKRQRLAETLL